MLKMKRRNEEQGKRVVGSVVEEIFQKAHLHLARRKHFNNVLKSKKKLHHWNLPKES